MLSPSYICMERTSSCYSAYEKIKQRNEKDAEQTHSCAERCEKGGYQCLGAYFQSNAVKCPNPDLYTAQLCDVSSEKEDTLHCACGTLDPGCYVHWESCTEHKDQIASDVNFTDYKIDRYDSVFYSGLNEQFCTGRRNAFLEWCNVSSGIRMKFIADQNSTSYDFSAFLHFKNL